jgi:hypothetical protein
VSSSTGVGKEGLRGAGWMLLWRQLVVGVLPTMCDTREGGGRGSMSESAPVPPSTEMTAGIRSICVL